MKTIAIILTLAALALSQNRIEITVEDAPTYSQTLSGNRASHTQLAELERFSF